MENINIIKNAICTRSEKVNLLQDVYKRLREGVLWN